LVENREIYIFIAPVRGHHVRIRKDVGLYHRES